MRLQILIIVPILIILFFYFFNPLCGFHSIGSSYPEGDGCNICYCELFGSGCTLMGCPEYEIDYNFTCSNITSKSECMMLPINFSRSFRVCFWDSESETCNSERVNVKCKDSDGGLNYEQEGIVYGFGNDESDHRVPHYDYCGMAGNETGKLKEFYCEDEYNVDSILFECPNGCLYGECIADN